VPPVPPRNTRNTMPSVEAVKIPGAEYEHNNSKNSCDQLDPHLQELVTQLVDQMVQDLRLEVEQLKERVRFLEEQQNWKE